MATNGTNGTHDLAGEAQAFLARLDKKVSSLEELYPYSSPEQRAEVPARFDAIYDDIGLTTLSSPLEKAILKAPEKQAISDRIRRAYNLCEAEIEIATSTQMIQAGSVEKARKILYACNLGVFYDRFLRQEWTALSTVLGRTPQSVAIFGSGAMPETAIWILDEGEKLGNPVKVLNIDIDLDRLALSKKVFKCLEIDDSRVSFEGGDAREVPEDLSAFDVVYFFLMVGRTEEERESIFYDVVSRLKPGAVIIARTSQSLKTIAYAPVPIQSPRLVKILKPVLTVHGHGDRQGMVNASVVISRRI